MKSRMIPTSCDPTPIIAGHVAQRWMTTSRSSVISRTAQAGPSFVLPDVLDAAVRHLVAAERRRLVDGDAAELEPSAARSAESIDAVKIPAWRP